MDEEKTIIPEEDLQQAVKPLNISKTVGRGPWRVFAVVGVICSLAAWGAFFFDPLVAVVLACAGFMLSVLGAVMVGRGCLRDLSITFAIAAFVLMVVYGIFYWGVPYAVHSL